MAAIDAEEEVRRTDLFLRPTFPVHTSPLSYVFFYFAISGSYRFAERCFTGV